MVAHRVIMAICDVGGIQALNADVLGSRNTLNLVHCVFQVRFAAGQKSPYLWFIASFVDFSRFLSLQIA